MPYQSLFSLTLTHDYYQDRRCPDLSLEPTATCQKIMRDHRLLLKLQPDGLRIMATVAESGQPEIPLSDDLSFMFFLKLSGPNFHRFSALPTEYDAARSLHVFTNHDFDTPGTMSLSPSVAQLEGLTRSSSALAQSIADAIDIKKLNQTNVFGLVEISNNSTISLDASEPSRFRLNFAAKQHIWKYYLIADRAQSDLFSIADKEATLSFSKAEIGEGDRILTTIQHRFPTSQPILFQSSQPVSCQETGRKNIQLLKSGHTQPWIEHLPNPPDRHGIQVINLLQEL
ncbi:MAG: hypothetical protein AAFQ63_19785 [Cyanobacteria bacterium J06621_11]